MSLTEARATYLAGTIIICCGNDFAALIGFILWVEAFCGYMADRKENETPHSSSTPSTR